MKPVAPVTRTVTMSPLSQPAPHAGLIPLRPGPSATRVEARHGRRRGDAVEQHRDDHREGDGRPQPRLVGHVLVARGVGQVVQRADAADAEEGDGHHLAAVEPAVEALVARQHRQGDVAGERPHHEHEREGHERRRASRGARAGRGSSPCPGRAGPAGSSGARAARPRRASRAGRSARARRRAGSSRRRRPRGSRSRRPAPRRRTPPAARPAPAAARPWSASRSLSAAGPEGLPAQQPAGGQADGDADGRSCRRRTSRASAPGVGERRSRRPAGAAPGARRGRPARR